VEPYFDVVFETCCVTGQKKPCIARKHLISSSFTDWSLCAAPASPYVGVDVFAAWTYGTRADGKKRDFCPERHACWVASDTEFRKITRPEIRDMVLHGYHAGKTWAGWITTSYKKHGSIRAKVNTSPHGVWGFDDTCPDASNERKVSSWWDTMRIYQEAGISRMSMESGEMPPGIMKSIPLETWMEFKDWSSDKIHSNLYRLLAYLLPSKEEIKIENMRNAL
jgi:hypothetical protein